MWVGLIQSTEGLSTTKRQQEGEFTLSAWAKTSSFCLNTLVLWLSDSDQDIDYPAPTHPQFSGLQTWSELYHQLSWFSSLQMADCGTSWLLSLCEPRNILLYISVYILLVLFLWRILTKTAASNSSPSSIHMPFCTVRLRVWFPAPWTWIGYVTCSNYRSDSVPTLGLTLKWAGMFPPGALGIQSPYKKLVLNSWVIRGIWKRTIAFLDIPCWNSARIPAKYKHVSDQTDIIWNITGWLTLSTHSHEK